MSSITIPSVGPLLRPRPSIMNLASPPLPGGRDRLRRLAALMLSRLSQQDREDLHAWLSVELKGKLLMGTQCSGTDSPLLSWQAFVLGVKDVIGLDFQIAHQYS